MMERIPTSKEIMDNYNYCVEIKCNKCGKILSFYPHRIIVRPECECGNDNTGSPYYDWPKNNYGDFTFLKDSIQDIYIETPFGRMGF